MRLLPAALRTPTRWRNGGGETIEVLASPHGAGLADFDWRVSIARIERDGPFSAFPGVDRTLAVLAGGPLTLAGPDGEEVVDAHSSPLRFDGADALEARIAAPCTVLNVMSRHGRCAHLLRLLDLPQRIPGEAVVIAADAGVVVAGQALAPLDAALSESGEALDVFGPSGSTVWAVTLHRHP